MIGNIHSIETMGLHDGPGIRTVFFLQGCPLRCRYCHNPDTWPLGRGQDYTVQQLVNIALEYKNYYKVSSGGVTISGGEPLLQKEFLIQLTKALKQHKIHVTLDTSGIGPGGYDELLKHVDLVMLDVKALDPWKFKTITRSNNKGFDGFVEGLITSECDVILRQVIIEGVNSSDDYIQELKTFSHRFKKLQRIELLPFHKMCTEKYDNLGIEFTYKHYNETCERTIHQLNKILA